MNNLKLFSILGFTKGLYFHSAILTLFLLANGVPLSHVVYAQLFYSLFVFFGEIPTGVFADRFGQKVSMVYGYFLEMIGILLVFLFPTSLGLYIAYSARGLAGSFLSGSEEALLYETSKRTPLSNFQKVYAKFLSNEQFGFMIAAALAGVVYKAWGGKVFAMLILATAGCMALSGLIALGIRDFRAEIKDPMEGRHLLRGIKESFSLIRKNDTIFTLAIVGILTLSGEYFLQDVYQPLFQIGNVPAVWIGLSLSLGTLLNVIVNQYTHLLEKYLSVEKILLIINVSLGCGYILLGLHIHPIFLVGLYVALNGMFNLQKPIISDYINSRTKSSMRTTVLSGISFIKRFFQVAATWVLGWIVGVWGIQTSLMVQGFYLIFGIGIGYYLLVRCGCTYKVENKEGEEFEFK